ncbi:WD40 repeat-containing protein [Histoplasma capsulatum]|uniref:WD40 repeat-containing protein n=1 Tax=Ajellomyces capsulatus TaxID=5037 RepID=A0A8A1MDE0_AJECA|nr:WD40 repeat-containing protein [Histoplasma capsulatum]
MVLDQARINFLLPLIMVRRQSIFNLPNSPVMRITTPLHSREHCNRDPETDQVFPILLARQRYKCYRTWLPNLSHQTLLQNLANNKLSPDPVRPHLINRNSTK